MGQYEGFVTDDKFMECDPMQIDMDHIQIYLCHGFGLLHRKAYRLQNMIVEGCDDEDIQKRHATIQEIDRRLTLFRIRLTGR